MQEHDRLRIHRSVVQHGEPHAVAGERFHNVDATPPDDVVSTKAVPLAEPDGVGEARRLSSPVCSRSILAV